MPRHQEMTTEEVRQLAAKSQSEDSLQRSIIDALEKLGYTVLTASRRVRKCQHCGEYPGGGKGGDRASKGIPDLLVSHHSWPDGTWLGLEIKKHGKIRWSSAEQRVLAEQRFNVVVQSIEAAIFAVNATKQALGLVSAAASILAEEKKAEGNS